MWEDMTLYWAWRGPVPKEGIPPTPTKKRIEYAEIVGTGRYLNGPKQGERIKMRLAVTVFDDDVAKEVNRDELEWYRKHSTAVLMPSNDQGKGQTPQADVPLDPPVGREGD